MAERFSFFNAKLDHQGNYDRVYNAEDMAAYFASFIGNGVYANSVNNLKVVPSKQENMIIVKAGKAWINGYFYELTEDVMIGIIQPNMRYSRIDSVVLSLNLLERRIELTTREGVASVAPTAPALVRNENVYDIKLADVFVRSHPTDITEADITDTRGFNDVCGYVSGVVDQIDTDGLFSQYQAEFDDWFAHLQNELNSNQAANLQLQIDNAIDYANIARSDATKANTTADQAKKLAMASVKKSGDTMAGDLNLDGHHLKLDGNSANYTTNSHYVWNIGGAGNKAYNLNYGVVNGGWKVASEGDGTLQFGDAQHRLGQIYSTNSTISTSDRNKKKDIAEIDSAKAVEFVKGLKPVNYKFIDGTSGRNHTGFIAQDVEDLLGQLGMSGQDFAGFVKDKEDYALRYEEFIAVLCKALQATMAEVEELKRQKDVK